MRNFYTKEQQLAENAKLEVEICCNYFGLAGKAEGRGQKALMDLSLIMNVRTECTTTRARQGFKPPTKISEKVARLAVWV
jgi:hypothetical protein